jgi:hypothetical protein
VGALLQDPATYERLAELTDGIGPRLTGSAGAAAAVAWALATFRADGVKAWTEPVKVAHWVRGEEWGELLAPAPARPQRLALTALGGSPPTPAGGLLAEVVEVRSLEEVRALGEGARGKVILFQHGMATPEDYKRDAELRYDGPAAASAAGAAGALVRSLATSSLRTPHTGSTSFPPEVTPIPSAAVSTEDAELLHRAIARGPAKVRLTLGCGTADPPEVDSANVVAEIRGRERPDEVVVIGAHLDSWDLGTGAVDDGTGVAMVLGAMRAVARLGVPPRRTLRAVLFMNEEQGLSGAIAYAERHGAELPHHVAAMEMDLGAGRPLGLGFDAGKGSERLLSRVLAPLAGLGANRLIAHGGGSDLAPLRYAQVPALGLAQDLTRYFDLHHSAADTLDKVSPTDLAVGAAAVAAIAWGLAEAEETLPRPDPPTEPPWWRRAAPASGPAALDRPAR